MASTEEIAQYLEFQFALLPDDAPGNLVPLVELAAWMDGDLTFLTSSFMALDPHSPTASVEWLSWRALILEGVKLGVLEVRDETSRSPVHENDVWSLLTQIGSPGAPSDAEHPTSLGRFRARVHNSYACVWPGPMCDELVRLAAEKRPFADLQGDEPPAAAQES